MALTLQQKMDKADPNDLPDRFRQVEVGQLVSGMLPSFFQRTGLAAQLNHFEPEPGVILAVTEQPLGTAAQIIGPGVPPVAGQVSVAYDSNGIANLTFAAPIDAYDVVKTVIPTGKTINGDDAGGLGDLLSSDI